MPEPTPPAGEPIRRRDEILQVLYWLRGEGLEEAVTTTTLRRFLHPSDAASLEHDLQGLLAAGLLERDGAAFRLTPAGCEEGGRRFAEAFDGMLKQGHGACNDPACDCHALGPEACAHAHS